MTPLRQNLLRLPTPLHQLERVSEDLGIDLWIKRDDLTGFAFGGNKGRKLEYLMPDISRSGATTVITCGSLQSNFVRQLGVACAVNGVRCVAVVMGHPFAKEAGRPPNTRRVERGGNLVLDKLAKIELVEIPDNDWDGLFEHTERIARELEDDGETVYRIPVGGSTAVGAYGFYAAAGELLCQQPAIDTVVVASSSGSTQTGLTLGLWKTPTRVIGVSCDAEPDLAEEFVPIARDLSTLASLESTVGTIDRKSFDLRHDWVGDAYGVPSHKGTLATEYLARREGIFLDPVYSAKAFSALIDLAREGQLKGRTVFWHTGGTPALFTY